MNAIYISPLINILLVTAFIIDRVFRLKSINEFKEAKQSQIENLEQQLESERRNNDIEITDMHKKRYESLKLILQEREIEINTYQSTLLNLQSSLDDANKEMNLKYKISEMLIKELNRLEKYKHYQEVEKKTLLAKL